MSLAEKYMRRMNAWARTNGRRFDLVKNRDREYQCLWLLDYMIVSEGPPGETAEEAIIRAYMGVS